MAKTIKTTYLTNVEINGIKIDTSIKCSSGNYTGYLSRYCSYIVMHYTGNYKDTARANANYFTGGGRGASAHFFVDDINIHQSVGLNNMAWHCGTYRTYYHRYCRNNNSIGIEMCCTAGNYKISNKTKENSAYLCAYLCKMLGIKASDVDTYVLRHYDVTHKVCPAQMAYDSNKEWADFKKQVKKILEKDTKKEKKEEKKSEKTNQTTNKFKSFTGYVTATELNVRKGAGATYNVLGTLKKNKSVSVVGEKGEWYKIKYNNGTAYVSKQYISATKPKTTSKKTSSFTPYKVKVTAKAGLNVRKSTSTLSKRISSLPYGTVVTISKVSGKWGYVSNKGGWISLSYTSKV